MLRPTLMTLLLCGFACAGPQERRQDDPPAGEAKPAKQDEKQEASKKSPRELVTEMLAKEGIRVDTDKRRILAEGKITVTRDFLEFVAIGPNGKKHEALVTLRCRGSSLNAALLALGLEPGKNADFIEIEPRPTREEYEAGAPLYRVVPPTGPELALTVSWHDEHEKLVEKPVEALIIDVATEKPIENARWIYFESLVAPIEKGKPPVFVADYEGNFIATYYAKPDSHFITLDHERARDDQNWFANTEALPPAGTPCTLVITVKKATTKPEKTEKASVRKEDPARKDADGRERK
ncbi:MAG: hypothetical protein KDC95_04605 [Planctomycetes bacterium]|nr:hypothetical protein [Planctomycetota bacterium]